MEVIVDEPKSFLKKQSSDGFIGRMRLHPKNFRRPSRKFSDSSITTDSSRSINTFSTSNLSTSTSATSIVESSISRKGKTFSRNALKIRVSDSPYRNREDVILMERELIQEVMATLESLDHPEYFADSIEDINGTEGIKKVFYENLTQLSSFSKSLGIYNPWPNEKDKVNKLTKEIFPCIIREANSTWELFEELAKETPINSFLNSKKGTNIEDLISKMMNPSLLPTTSYKFILIEELFPYRKKALDAIKSLLLLVKVSKGNQKDKQEQTQEEGRQIKPEDDAKSINSVKSSRSIVSFRPISIRKMRSTSNLVKQESGLIDQLLSGANKRSLALAEKQKKTIRLIYRMVLKMISFKHVCETFKRVDGDRLPELRDFYEELDDFKKEYGSSDVFYVAFKSIYKLFISIEASCLTFFRTPLIRTLIENPESLSYEEYNLAKAEQDSFLGGFSKYVLPLVDICEGIMEEENEDESFMLSRNQLEDNLNYVRKLIEESEAINNREKAKRYKEPVKQNLKVIADILKRIAIMSEG